MSASFKHLDSASLPPDWSIDFFGNLVDFKLGKTPPRGSSVYWKEGKYPWVSISDMTPHGVVTETSEKVSQQAYDTVFRGCLVPEGSLLMSFKLTIGRVSRLGMPAFHNEAIISFRPDQETLSDDFLRYYLSQINYRDYQDTAIKGKTLNKGKLNSLEIALPPLPEQKKIAHVLSTVQRAIEAQERIIQITIELKKTLMHKLFTEGLHNEPQKQTEIGPVPESWEVIPLGELVSFVTGKLNSNAAVEGGEYPFFTCSKQTFWIDRYAFDTEAILLSGNNAQAIYSVKYFKGKFNAYQRTYVVTIKDSTRMSYPFLAQMLTYSLSRLRAISIGSSTKYLTLGLLTHLPVAVPRYPDGVQIGEWLNTVDRKIEEHDARQNLLQDLFRTLLYELMTAKVRVNELQLP